MAGYAGQTRTAILWGAQIRVPLAAIAENRGHRGKCLAIVQDGRRLKRAHNCREWRLQPRYAALAFERLQERRFFPAFVSTGAGMRVQVKIPTGPEYILA